MNITKYFSYFLSLLLLSTAFSSTSFTAISAEAQPEQVLVVSEEAYDVFIRALTEHLIILKNKFSDNILPTRAQMAAWYLFFTIIHTQIEVLSKPEIRNLIDASLVNTLNFSNEEVAAFEKTLQKILSSLVDSENLPTLSDILLLEEKNSIKVTPLTLNHPHPIENKIASPNNKKLQEPMHTPTNKKHRTCNQCGKAFAGNGNLKRHIRTHTNEKPYKCKQCEIAFTDSTSLKKHILTHTNERPYKCNECKSAFADRSNLRRHILTHTNEKPYACSLCKKTFTRNNSLKKHMLLHTNSSY